MKFRQVAFQVALPIAGLIGLVGAERAIAQTSPKPEIAAERLTSERQISYTSLQSLLRSGQWDAANQLTSQLTLQLANQQQRGYLVATDIRALPCADLKTIDRLWIYYSDSHFGLSPQAQLWQQLGGQGYEESLWFESFVGWTQTDPIANPAPATTPIGYLPFRPAYKTGIRNAFGGGWIREMPLRLEQCGVRF
jgi:GUN4-like